MLTLDTRLTLDHDAIISPNLCDRFEGDDLKRIGRYLYEGYQRDLQSRMPWERRMQAGMDLALQIQQDKSFPWPGCSNVAFPLVTIAVLQFHARAYPGLINGTEIAKCRVVGDDPDGKKFDRALRIGTHMSYQVLEEDAGWEEAHDKLLINYACVGTAFIKSYFSTHKGGNVSELVLAKDLVLNYWATSVDDCARKTHVLPLDRNEIYERVMRGSFRDVLDDAWFKSPPSVSAPTPTKQAVDNRQGIVAPQPDSTSRFICLECHCCLDLDGDGYEEPYIVTFEQTTQTVLRIVARFEENSFERDNNNRIIKIRANEYFTKYGFIPSPDGGIYDIGFGTLLGPLNESVNSAINQIFDAGTMATTAGGFLGRGVKIRGGQYSFAPLEWKRVDSTGDDLNKNIVPLPVREPSRVLFDLLTLLINYTNRVSGATDTMVGENPGQNTPAETTRTLVEQGSKIYSAIFKRTWRSMKEEFKKLYLLNAVYLSDRVNFGKNQMVLREDYLNDPREIVPAADPNLTSDGARVQQAMTMKQASMTTPGYDREAVERHFLKMLHIDGVEMFYPGIQKMPPPPNPKVVVEQMKQQGKQEQTKQKMMEVVVKLQSEVELNKAKILNLEAQAAKALAEAGGVAAGHQVALLDAQLGAAKHHDESIRGYLDLMLQHAQSQQSEESGNAGQSGAVGSMGAAPGNASVPAATPPNGGGR